MSNLLLCVSASALLFVGCVGSDGPVTATIKGTVLLDGVPMEGVVIAYEPQAPGRAYSGQTDPDGKFEMIASVGMHDVTITKEMSMAPDPNNELEDPIPSKYNTQSDLVRDVKSGENIEVFDLTTLDE